MKPSILITRPIIDAEILAEKLQRHGFTPLIIPMMEVKFLPDAILPDDESNGLIFTSANGVRALMHQLQNHQQNFKTEITSLTSLCCG